MLACTLHTLHSKRLLAVCLFELSRSKAMNMHREFNLLKIQTHILKVNIHCDGCRLQVRKLLHRTEGVFSVSIDVEEQKVTVSGDVDAATLIRKLNRAGKHAEPWPTKASNNKEDQRPNQQKQGKKPVCNTVKKQSHKSFRNQKHKLSDDDYDSDDEDDDDYDLRSLNNQSRQIQQQACRTQPPSMVMQENRHLHPQMMYLRSPAMAAAYTGYYSCDSYQSPYYLNDQVDDGYQYCYCASGNGDNINVCSIM